MIAAVTAVSKSDTHTFSKQTCGTITLVAGVGIAGDVHAGATEKHQSRSPQAETEPNLRQAHLLQAELHDELNLAGFAVAAGQLGENVTTRGIDLLALPTGARLRLGDGAIVEEAPGDTIRVRVKLSLVQPELATQRSRNHTCTANN